VSRRVRPPTVLWWPSCATSIAAKPQWWAMSDRMDRVEEELTADFEYLAALPARLERITGVNLFSIKSLKRL
jgi:hypothetical protein